MLTAIDKRSHPADTELAGFLARSLSKNDRKRIEAHLSACDECLDSALTAYDSVSSFGKRYRKKGVNMRIFKKINIYLLLTAISFSLSFVMPRFFIQLLVATLLLGIKWVADSKSTRMLIMVYEAWKKDGERGASLVLETLEKHHDSRF